MENLCTNFILSFILVYYLYGLIKHPLAVSYWFHLSRHDYSKVVNMNILYVHA
jgi:hypothetical protein